MRLQSNKSSPPYRGTFYRLFIAMLFWTTAVPVRADSAQIVTVPILRHGSHILVQSTLDGKPVTLILDTGATINMVTPQTAKRLNLTLKKEDFVVHGSGGDSDSTSIVSIGKLGIGTTVLKSQSASIVSLPAALDCDGLLGAPFFQAWVVTLDYAKLQMTLTPRALFQPPTDAAAFPLHFYGDVPFLEASVDGIQGQFMIDTGDNGDVSLSRSFVEKYHLRGKYTPSLQKVTGRGIGGLIYADLVRLPEFRIGSFRFSHMTAELSRQSSEYFDKTDWAGSLGGEIWRRFTLIFDYPEKKLFLTRNSHYEEPFVSDHTGLALDTQQGVALVQDVLADSPAMEAGVRKGEAVLTIDGKPVNRIKAWEIRALFRGKPGTKIRLHLRGADKTERDTTLTLRDML